MPHQVHRADVACIDASFFTLTYAERKAKLEGIDAVMTNLQGVCIGVSTADCIPILLFDQQKQVVAAVHAGWRGTVQRIAKKAVEVMEATYGSSPSDLLAQIGPGIHLESFEVGDEVYQAFENAGFDMNSISKKYEKWHIDLPECNRLQLISAGVPETQISVSPVCTYMQSDTYFSARRLGIESGRIFTGIILRRRG
jgi:YfiH family protein